MKYLKLYVDFLDCMEELEEAERGRLFTAMLRYARDGEQPVLPGNERFLWSAARQQLDRMEEQYRKVCAVNASNARKRPRPGSLAASAPKETSFDLEEIQRLVNKNSSG